MYVSTRGGAESVSAAAAIKMGLAGDGGLYVPVHIPMISNEDLSAMVPLDYQGRAAQILKLFLTDYTDTEIREAVSRAYSGEKFDAIGVAPVVTINNDTHVLELWHGPTSAFKDMALQLLPQLLSQALTKTGETDEIVILVATSGDTGKAALEGFKDVPQIKIIVFFPQQGVSDIQKLQMVTQEGANVGVVAVHGNFDDAQTGVKKIFSDHKMSEALAAGGYKLSSANSINWGRLVPQIVYYFSAYLDLVSSGSIKLGQPVNFVVPTGNFGNILAGYYAKLMGLPIHKLICASNSNNVLTDFLQTGEYNRLRPFHKTISPSMDILISSNLERLLYLISGDAGKVRNWMDELAATGRYQIDQPLLSKIQDTFVAAWAEDASTMETIKSVYEKFSYLADPHTAVAWQAAEEYRAKTGDKTPVIIVSTASPFKFNDSVLSAIGYPATADMDEFQKLAELSDQTGWTIPSNLSQIHSKPVRHKEVCHKEEMPQQVMAFLAAFRPE